MATKHWVGLLMLVLLASSIYVMLPNEIKILVDNYKTTLYIWNETRWSPAAVEYSKIFDGRSLELATSRAVVSSRNELNFTNITRVVYFNEGKKLTDNYEFDGNIKDKELIPVRETHIVENATGMIYQYEVRILGYDGENIDLLGNTEFQFGKIKVSWDSGNYYAKIFKYQKYGTILIKYKVKTNYETYSIRLFDPAPVLTCKNTKCIGSDKIPLETKNETLGDFTVKFNHVESRANAEVFDFSVQNLKNTKVDADITSILEPLISDSIDGDVQFYEWKNISYTVPTYDTILINETRWNATYDNTTGDLISNVSYEYSYYSQIENGTEILYKLDWKPSKSYLFNGNGKVEKNYGVINIDKYGSKQKDDTVNGTKLFRIIIPCNLVKTESGWGCSGLFMLKIDGYTFFDTTNSSWWDNNWGSYRNQTITNNAPASIVMEPITTNITGLTLGTENCTKELRIIDDASNENVFDVLSSGGSGSDYWCNVIYGVNISASSSKTYSYYYNNPSATEPSYSKLSYTINGDNKGVYNGVLGVNISSQSGGIITKSYSGISLSGANQDGYLYSGAQQFGSGVTTAATELSFNGSYYAIRNSTNSGYSYKKYFYYGAQFYDVEFLIGASGHYVVNYYNTSYTTYDNKSGTYSTTASAVSTLTGSRFLNATGSIIAGASHDVSPDTISWLNSTYSSAGANIQLCDWNSNKKCLGNIKVRFWFNNSATASTGETIAENNFKIFKNQPTSGVLGAEQSNNQAPQWSGNVSSIGTLNSPSYFNTTWSDDIDANAYNFSFTQIGFSNGTLNNYTSIRFPQNKTHFNYTFKQTGNYNWTVYANDSSNAWNKTNTVGFNIPNLAPKWSNNVSSIGNLNQPSYFNTTWTDDFDTNGFNFSFTQIGFANGTLNNYTSWRFTANKSHFNYTFTQTGDYNWTMYANDSSNAWNKTNTFGFNIASPAPSNIYLNSLEQDRKYEYGTKSNITVIGTAGNTYCIMTDLYNEGNLTCGTSPLIYNYTTGAYWEKNFSDTGLPVKYNLTKINMTSATYTVTSFNDSSTAKNFTFTGNSNQTTWIRLPKNSTIKSAKLNLNGYNYSNLTSVNSSLSVSSSYFYNFSFNTHKSYSSYNSGEEHDDIVFNAVIIPSYISLIIQKVFVNRYVNLTTTWSDFYENVPNCNLVSYSNTSKYLYDGTKYICINTSSENYRIAIVSVTKNTLSNNPFYWDWYNIATYYNSLVSNPYLDVGSDGNKDWSYTGEFNSPETTSDFKQNITSYLNSCTADAEGKCNVPVIAHSDSGGKLELSGLFVSYELNQTDTPKILVLNLSQGRNLTNSKINITGFLNVTYPLDIFIDILSDGVKDLIFPGYLVGIVQTQNKMSNGLTTENVILPSANSSFIRYLNLSTYMPFLNILNFTAHLYGKTANSEYYKLNEIFNNTSPNRINSTSTNATYPMFVYEDFTTGQVSGRWESSGNSPVFGYNNVTQTHTLSDNSWRDCVTPCASPASSNGNMRIIDIDISQFDTIKAKINLHSSCGAYSNCWFTCISTGGGTSVMGIYDITTRNLYPMTPGTSVGCGASSGNSDSRTEDTTDTVTFNKTGNVIKSYLGTNWLYYYGGVKASAGYYNQFTIDPTHTYGLYIYESASALSYGQYGSGSGTGKGKFLQVNMSGVSSTYTGAMNNYTNSIIRSLGLFNFTDPIIYASLDASEILPSGSSINYYLSANGGGTWESVTKGTTLIFTTSGRNLTYRADLFNGTNGRTPIIKTLTIEVPTGYASNISIDIGADGSIEWVNNSVLNSTQNMIVNFNASSAVSNYISSKCTGLTCLIPFRFSSVTAGAINYTDLNYSYKLYDIDMGVSIFNTHLINNNLTNITFGMTNGIIEVKDLVFTYPKDFNITVTAFNMANKLQNITRTIMARYSQYNLTYPTIYQKIGGFKIKSNNDTNLTPFGQRDSIPIWNITASKFNLDPFNLAVKLNEAPNSCLNFKANNVSYAGNATNLSTTYKFIQNNTGVGVSKGYWFWLDLANCGAGMIQLTNWTIRTICSDCVYWNY